MIPRDLCNFCVLKLEIKMANEDNIFRRIPCKTLEWMADIERRCFCLELEILKDTTNDDGEAAATETPSASETSNLDDNSGTEHEVNNDSQELEDFISAQKSSYTVKKTKSDMRTLKRFCATFNETREPKTLTAAELDNLLFKIL